jgi:SAM-dependent methyltransferase
MTLARAAGAREYLDESVSPADRQTELADIHRLNAWFGGYRLTERAIAQLTAGRPAAETLWVLDVGGGSGYLASRLVDRARRRERRLRAIVADREISMTAGRRSDVTLVQADALALPFRAGAVHVVTASLTLHHLEPGAVMGCLREMRAAARLGVVVNDLLRTRLALVLVWLATRLFTWHRFARHDGPLSVRRAYSPAELRALAVAAGLAAPMVRRHPWWGRLVAVFR